MGRFDLTDGEWAVIAPLLSQHGRGPRRKDDRQVPNGIFYILRTGSPWRDLPARYGLYTTVYNRYIRWTKRGVWAGIFDALARDCKDALIFIDRSIVKAHRAAAGAKGGSWRKVSAAHAAAGAVRFTPL
ncbi:MAG: IS5 family transposase [Pseudomonadota bacterium]